MSNPIESEHQPRSKTPSAFSRIITSWRTWTTLAFAFAGGTGAKIAADKWAEERAKSPQGETKDIDGGIMPSAQAFEDPDSAFILAPTLIPTATPTRIPAKPTAEPVTPAATATSKPAETPPTPTIGPLKPSHEKTFSTGSVEKYDMVTEKNFDKIFTRVSKEEFEQLLQEQPDLPLFPFVPLDETFSIGEFQTPAGSKSINLYSSHALIVNSLDTEITVNKGGPKNEVRGLGGTGKQSDTVSADYVYNTSDNNPKLMPKVDVPIRVGFDTRGRFIKKGTVLAEFFGSDPIDRPKYTAPANQLSFSVTKLEKLPQPIITKEPDGSTFERTAISTSITPSLTNPNSWVHTKDGRIAIPDITTP